MSALNGALFLCRRMPYLPIEIFERRKTLTYILYTLRNFNQMPDLQKPHMQLKSKALCSGQ